MLKKLILILVIFGILCGVYAFIEPYLIETKEVTISSSQIPEAYDGKRIVFLTDIHYGPFYSIDRVNNLVNQTNALHPDMILLGGDYVTDNTSNVGPVFESLSKLNAPMGVYGVLGNNDPRNVSIQAMKDAGITYIGNGGVWIGNNSSRIRVGGVADMDTDVPNQLPILNGVIPSDFVILVTHKPDYFPEVSKSKVDLVLAGHTHGGQITFFGLYAPFVSSKYGQEYVSGEKTLGNDTMIISNGVGTVWAPLRFFARPQIIVITLKRA